MKTLITTAYLTVAGLGCVWGALQGYAVNATRLLVVSAVVYFCIAALLMLAFSYEDAEADSDKDVTK